MQERCPWARTPLEIEYHDTEWCIPERDDLKLFELLVLESMQAGLSWRTILEKRASMRIAFDSFDPQVIARYDAAHLESLLQMPGIIRNKRKLASMVENARAFLDLQETHGSFSDWLWEITDGCQLVNAWTESTEMPATSPLSEQLSRRMRACGFRFVGPTICYSYMQAAGLINDHLVTCPWYERAVSK